MTFSASLKVPFWIWQTILQWSAVTSSLFSCKTATEGGHKHTAESPLVMRTTATYPIDREQGYRQRKQQSVHVCSGSADWRLVRCPPWWASCGARDTSLIRKGDDAFLGQNTISQRRIKPTQTGWLGRHIPRVHSYEHMFGVRGSAGVSETRQEAG